MIITKCYLYNKTRGVEFILTDILSTFCKDHVCHFLVYDIIHGHMQCIEDESTFKLDFVCRPDIRMETVLWNEAWDQRNIYIDNRGMFWDPKRTLPRDTHNPEREEEDEHGNMRHITGDLTQEETLNSEIEWDAKPGAPGGPEFLEEIRAQVAVSRSERRQLATMSGARNRPISDPVDHESHSTDERGRKSGRGAGNGRGPGRGPGRGRGRGRGRGKLAGQSNETKGRIVTSIRSVPRAESSQQYPMQRELTRQSSKGVTDLRSTEGRRCVANCLCLNKNM